MEALTPATPIEWSIADRPMPGERVSGDRCVVTPFEGGALLAVIDGLGHGEEASEAAELAALTLASHADDAPVDLVRRCHERLRRTRGAVMALASVRPSSGVIEWVGVGNAEALRVSAREGERRAALISRGGVVGYLLPPLRSTTTTAAAGDLVVMTTDGIGHAFTVGLDPTAATRVIASSILTRYARSNDDAAVLVARVLDAGGAR